MKKEVIVKLHSNFEKIVQVEAETEVEFWLARDLQAMLGYAKWDNFSRVVEKAKISCKTAGYKIKDHFLDVRKMVELGSSAQRQINDIALTRYACYLIAQNGDPSKEQIAFAQTYFAVQTRKQELIEKRIAEVERLDARKRLTASEKELSGIIYERVGDQKSFGRIRSKGDAVLFGGLTTKDMKHRLDMPASRALADFLPMITIKAKDFANEITNFNIKRDDLRNEQDISREHVSNNRDVRDLLGKRKIIPERLPAEEDAKKVERRLASDEKKLSKNIDSFDGISHIRKNKPEP
ncbi:MAG: DNA damage-inducible protein D [Candidatus Thiodiazotropha sp. (ex Rostrolucina anterorostrata)]|nr:DNA damage-inducible protein D [Candidatus Thiodiazotropha sp. (ex Rostrolucina anterorostrata)]